MDKPETIADIITKMRRDGIVHNSIPTKYLNAYADRLEAAIKRERGDAEKLREAVEESRRIASDLGGCRLNDYWKLNEIVRVCDAALDTTSKQNTQEEK